MSRLTQLILAFVLSPALWAFAADPNQPTDKLIDKQNPALTWIVGVGVLVLTLIAGFKHPGRTHLD